MPITKSGVAVLASVSIAAGGTKAAPAAGGTGAAVNTSGHYGGDLTYVITNGATAPGAPLILTFQASHNGTTDWYDYYSVSGDIIASSINSGTIWLDQGVMFVRVLAYGNTTNAVTAMAHLQAITAV